MIFTHCTPVGLHSALKSSVKDSNALIISNNCNVFYHNNFNALFQYSPTLAHSLPRFKSLVFLYCLLSLEKSVMAIAMCHV